jgi:hypothetical protein
MMRPPKINGNRTDLAPKIPASNETRLEAKHQVASRSQSRRRSIAKKKAIQGIASAKDSPTHPQRDTQIRQPDMFSSRRAFWNPIHDMTVRTIGVATTIMKAMSCTTIGRR